MHNPVEIVGVIANARQTKLQKAPRPTIFFNNFQAPMFFAQLVVRTAGDPTWLARAQRTREIGIRMALGAERADVRRMVLREGAILAAEGTGIGLRSIGFDSHLGHVAFRDDAYRYRDARVCLHLNTCPGSALDVHPSAPRGASKSGHRLTL